MAKTSQRMFAMVLAIVFLVTSLGTSGFVVWQIRQDNKNKQAADKALKDSNEESNVDNGTLENFTPRSEPVTTLEKIDLTQGTGKEATPGAKVKVHYTGALVNDGSVFESSKTSGQPVEFALSGLIKGWQDGIPGMKVGGVRRLVIPYVDAYGEAGSPPKIPAKSDLVFDIELLDVQ